MKFEKAYQLLLEDKLTDALEKSDLTNEQKKLATRVLYSFNDLKVIGKYVDFVIRNMQEIEQETTTNIVITLQHAEKFWNNLENKDLNKLTYYELFQQIKDYIEKRNNEKYFEEFVGHALEMDNNGQGLFINKQTFKKDEYIMFMPFDYDASSTVGMYGGTNSWCIVGAENHWERYTEEFNTFIFILSKNIPKNRNNFKFFKCAIQIKNENEITFWDYEDDCFDIEQLVTKTFLTVTKLTKQDIMNLAKTYNFFDFKDNEKIIKQNDELFPNVKETLILLKNVKYLNDFIDKDVVFSVPFTIPIDYLFPDYESDKDNKKADLAQLNDFYNRAEVDAVKCKLSYISNCKEIMDKLIEHNIKYVIDTTDNVEITVQSTKIKDIIRFFHSTEGEFMFPNSVVEIYEKIIEDFKK